MRLYLVVVCILVFVLSSYGQEVNQKLEKVGDSPSLPVNAVKGSEESLLKIEETQDELKSETKKTEQAQKKSEKEQKRIEKDQKRIEKKAKKVEDLKKNIESEKKDITKSEDKIADYEEKLAIGIRKGKLAPNDISKLNDKIAKENILILKHKEKIRKFEQKTID